MLRAVYLFIRNIVANLYILSHNIVKSLLLPGLAPVDFVRLRIEGNPPLRRRRGLFRSVFGARRLSIEEIAGRLERLASDHSLRGVLIEIAELSCGLSKVIELREAVEGFRGSGKRVVALITTAGLKEYLLAAAAAEIVMPPSGTVMLTGVSAEVLFFADLLDWFGIEVDGIAVGRYKGTLEPFTRREMSEAMRENLDKVMAELWQWVLGVISASRNLSTAEVEALAGYGPVTAARAREKRLIDTIAYRDELNLILAAGASVECSISDFEEWKARKLMPLRWTPLSSSVRPRIALLRLYGIIREGESIAGPGGVSATGAFSVAEALKRIARDRTVKGAVLRIESRGGSASASDLIWREVSILSRQKPIVVSMGDVAASGAYYAASGSSCIVAYPTSLTGSIGVVSGKLVVEKAARKAGIGHASVSRGEMAGLFSPFSSFGSQQRERLQEHASAFYELFLKRVGDGRRMDPGKLAEASEGRIFCGGQAVSLGLVDSIGTLRAAFDRAKQMCNIAPEAKVEIVEFETEKKGGPLKMFLRAFRGRAPAEAELVRESFAREGIACFGAWEIFF